MTFVAALAGLLAMPWLAALVPAGVPAGRANAPAIVFVSRQPVAGDPLAIPGFGPRHRTTAPGGRLMVRANSGRVSALIPDGVFHDVADPAVSYDGRRIAFAAAVTPDSAWRLWVVGADGRGLAPLTHTGGATVAPGTPYRYDDFDPAWLPDGRVVFASTRYRQIAEQGGVPASNLFVTGPRGDLERITSDRNGAEEPSVDPRTGFVVCARWWTSRFLASDRTPRGVTTDRALAVAADDVDLWHAITLTPGGDFPKLAGGFPRERPLTMAYQPVILDDGTLVGVSAGNTSLVPAPGETFVHAFPGGFARPVRLPLARACAPASIGARRLVVSADPAGTGDFGLYVVSLDGGPASRLVDLPGTLELDAALLAPRRSPPAFGRYAEAVPGEAPPRELESHMSQGHTFRFDCLNVFANAPVDAPFPDAPPFQHGLKIRFFAVLPGAGGAGGDSLVLVREAPVREGGAVHEDGLPSDVPMFEQLVDARGNIVRSASGPAHVPGFNTARFGSGTQCVGCHIGHSAIAVANSSFEGKRFNAAPAATATASSSAPGTAGPQAAVDRRAKGPAATVAWIAEGAEREHLRLEWRSPIAIDSLILYALSANPSGGTNLRVRESQLDLFLNGRAVSRQVVRSELSPQGTRWACGGVLADAVEFRPLRATGTVLGRARVGIAEIATVARLAESGAGSGHR